MSGDYILDLLMFLILYVGYYFGLGVGVFVFEKEKLISVFYIRAKGGGVFGLVRFLKSIIFYFRF